MRLKVFIGTTLSALVTAFTCPLFAQGTAPSEDRRPEPTAPSNEPAPPGSTSQPPESAPKDTSPLLPPEATPAAEPSPPSDAPAPPPPTMAIAADEAELHPTRRKIGSVLSPLVVTAGVGYAYASVTHPDLRSRDLSGALIEVTVGTELERRFRLALAFTSFETKVRRISAAQWEEGEFTPRVARLGLHTLLDPTDPYTGPGGGGTEVEKTLHVHSVGPRMDFLPLGSQGPYLGMTAAVGFIQSISTPMRFGANLAARIGGEWRPFQAFAVAIEGGAHGQIYEDAKAAIPYAMTRITLLLEPSLRKSSGSTPQPMLPMQRTLPMPTPR
jgi:hypothetical protein